MPDLGVPSRRAVLDAPERPVGVTAITGFLLILAVALFIIGIVAIVVVPIEIASDLQDPVRAGYPDGKRALIVNLVGVIAGGIGFIAAAGLLAWVGIANGQGRRWAWTGISASSIIMIFPAFMWLAASLIFVVTMPRGEDAIVTWGSLAFAATCLAALGTVVRYYRRDEVRSWFGFPPGPRSL